MTDNDIIKALELCFTSKGTIETCCRCPCHKYGKLCKAERDKAALDLINRQRAEIERLTSGNEQNFDKWTILEKRTEERYAELFEEAKEAVRAEAIKEFAERLKAGASRLQIGGKYDYKITTINGIDNLVKEMTEEQK